MEFENVLCENHGGILYITLNRPEVRNALSPAMWRDISAAVKLAREDDSVKVVIIAGAGDQALASGADIQEIHDRNYLGQLAGTATLALKNLEDLYKPVICAVNGYALGGGCELALACDLRFAGDWAKIGQPEIGLGIIPGFGGTRRLTRLVGRGRALEMILGGDRIDAATALKIGLVERVYPPEELMPKTMEFARRLAGYSLLALQAAKTVIVGAEDPGLEKEQQLFAQLFAGPDQKEGMAAFLERRPPRFIK